MNHFFKVKLIYIGLNYYYTKYKIIRYIKLYISKKDFELLLLQIVTNATNNVTNRKNKCY